MLRDDDDDDVVVDGNKMKKNSVAKQMHYYTGKQGRKPLLEKLLLLRLTRSAKKYTNTHTRFYKPNFPTSCCFLPLSPRSCWMSLRLSTATSIHYYYYSLQNSHWFSSVLFHWQPSSRIFWMEICRSEGKVCPAGAATDSRLSMIMITVWKRNLIFFNLFKRKTVLSISHT